MAVEPFAFELPDAGAATEKEIARLVVGLPRPGQRLLAVRFLEVLATVDADISDADVSRALAAVEDVLPAGSGTPEADLGPFYSSSGLARRWQVSRQALNQRVHRGTLLGLPASDGSTVFPAFQFVDPERPTPTGALRGLPEVIRVLLQGGIGQLGAAGWLRAPQGALGDGTGGWSAEAWLRAGGDVEPVLALARADARRWAE